MSRGQRRLYYILVSIWAMLLIAFGYWWFEPAHIRSIPGLVANTLIIIWNFLIPAYFFYFVGRMSRANPAIATPDFRVAMVVTKAPSEPFDVIKKTLMGCMAQTGSYEIWLADEDPTTEVVEWCDENNIDISSRKHAPHYHKETWPRRLRCKEGNLAYFYDHFGFEQYDVVVQLDADHIPAEGYLQHMIRPFADHGVGYVSAPSICDANADKSWSARARLWAEGIMHGPLQAGYSDGWAPLCIGSHYAVRTKALKEIGGLGPELAEDHSTTLMMTAGGWKGVHAFDAEAHGDGPATFADCMTQEFQWSRSLAILLFTLTPKLWHKLSFKMKVEFLFSQLWFPLFAFVMFFGLTLPIFSLFVGEPLVSIPYLTFLYMSTLVNVSIFSVVYFLKKNNWLRPQNARIISWETAVFQLTRWPFIFFGVLMGMVDSIRGKSFSIKLTPKGSGVTHELPAIMIAPYIVLCVVYLLCIFLIPFNANVSGYYYFSLMIVFFYIVSIIVIIYAHHHENT